MSQSAAVTTERLPVALLTGFLGSGKTTLLNRLLKHPDMGETAVIVNEFGEIGLDHALIEQVDGNTILLDSGCLCCTVKNDLTETLWELIGKRRRGEVPPFQRVVIETTGLADPAPILHLFLTDPLLLRQYRLQSVITTVDAVNGWNTLDKQFEAVKQVAMADRLVLTKTDLAKPAATAMLLQRLRKLNPGAPVVRAADDGFGPDDLFRAELYDPATKTADVQNWLRAEAYEEPAHGHNHGHDHDHDHDHGHDHHHHHDHDHQDVNRHDDQIRAFSMVFDEPMVWDTVAQWLDLLAAYRGEDLLRIKGILNIEGVDKPVALHGVQHLFHPPATLPGWPDADRRSRIVFITRNVGRDLIEQTLASIRSAQPAA
jgi:G3E family GTPase